MSKKETLRNEAYLKEKGWVKKENVWLDPKRSNKLGGHGISYAIKIQEERDLIEKNGCHYAAKRNRYGFGWYIYQNTGNKATSKILVEQLSREEAEDIAEKLNENPQLNFGFATLKCSRIIKFIAMKDYKKR